ncbi:hypothetical protein [Sutcliffiella rhizosphaerae]|uniref:hypothetical protein n=1 Tax=Sutcliffiella rhizosphaerae TaxID=2880967 RepID=UPI001E36EC75|nr:hypothetical protein [Sutcliffiella rhizosphaerae]
MLTLFIIRAVASYPLEEVFIRENTKITGVGFMSFKIKDKVDLKKNQWVRVWVTEDVEQTARKIVVFNLL